MPSSPGRLLLRCALGLLLAWSVGFAVQRQLPAADIRWVVTVFHSKRAVLASAPPGRRILLVGGSGTHFGPSAKQLSELTGAPAVNLGLLAALGVAGLTAVYLDDVRPGDLVVFIPEYSVLASREVFGGLTESFLVATHQPLAGAADPAEWLRMLLNAGAPGFRSIARGVALRYFKYKRRDPYSTTVDAFGDPVDVPAHTNDLPFGKVGELSESFVGRVALYRQRLEARGARLVIGMPLCHVELTAAPVRQRLENMVRTLSRVAPVVMDTDVELITDPRYFSDGICHLTREGRRRRTEHLARQLEPYLTPARP